MKKKLLVLLSLATLGLVSCGGGNDGASTGTPVVAQATIFDPTANGGCMNSSSMGGGDGPPLNQAQVTACSIANYNAATPQQCYVLGGCFSRWSNPGCQWIPPLYFNYSCPNGNYGG